MRRILCCSLLLVGLALAGPTCVPSAPGKISLNPPVRPLPKGRMDFGLSAGATVLGGLGLANIWFRYGFLDALSLDLSGFYLHPLVGGGNLALRWNAHRGSVFSFTLIPGVSLGGHIDGSGNRFHIAPSLSMIFGFNVASHLIYLGARTQVASVPNSNFVTTLYNSAALGFVFTIATRYHIHLELMGTVLTEASSGASLFFGVPTAGFSVDF